MGTAVQEATPSLIKFDRGNAVVSPIPQSAGAIAWVTGGGKITSVSGSVPVTYLSGCAVDNSRAYFGTG